MERKKGRISTLTVISGIVLIMAVAFAVIYFINANPKNKIKSSVDTVFESIEKEAMALVLEGATNDYVNTISTITIDVEDIQEVGFDIEKLLENFSLIVENNMAVKEDYFDIEMNFKYKDVDNKFKIIKDEEELYLEAKDYFDEYIDLSEYIEEFDSLDVEQESSDYDFESIKNIINDYIDQAEITEVKEKTIVEDKEIEATKTTIDITGKLLAALVKEFDENDTYTYDEELENTVYGKFSIYTTGILPKCVKAKFEIEEEEESDSYYISQPTLGYIEVSNFKDTGFDYAFSVYEETINGSFEMVENSKSDFDYKLVISNKNMGTITFNMNLKEEVLDSLEKEEVKASEVMSSWEFMYIDQEELIEKFISKNEELITDLFGDMVYEMFGDINNSQNDDIISNANKAKFIGDIAEIQSVVALEKAEQMIESNGEVDFEDFDVESGADMIDFIPYIDEDLAGKIYIEDGDIFFTGTGEEADWAREIDGITVIEPTGGISIIEPTKPTSGISIQPIN